ncbi:MAG: FtsX-like permease family protein [Nitrospirae bacterium]|nr:FtsX-like permease family protein [Nitrospirota bacterium]
MVSFRIVRMIKLGIKSLILHKLRSALTVLGIIFGVSSVIAMLSIGEGASWEAQKMIRILGSSNIIIKSVKPPDNKNASTGRTFVVEYGLTYDDAKRIASTIPSVKAVVPMRNIRQDMRYRHRLAEGQVIGTVPWYPDISNFRVSRGRFLTFTDMHKSANVCVLGAGIAKKLFAYEDPLGKEIKIGSDYYRVVGIMQNRGGTNARGGSNITVDEYNFNVYIPLTTARRRFGELIVRRQSGSFNMERIQLHQINVRVASPELVPATAKVIQNLLERFHKKKDFKLIIPLELLRQAEQTKRIFNVVLGSIAAISLLVGGIGIMNIMLASVTERTREIGIRRALGAKKKDIVTQFLVETVVLSAGGGLLGVVFGVTIPFLVSHFAKMKTIITPWSLILAFSISAAIGIIFGLYPARKAANMDPIEALRHE